MGTLNDYRVMVDDIEYELDVHYTYPVDRRAGIAIQIERVTMVQSQQDIDPEIFQSRMGEALTHEIERACDEYAEARDGTNWR